MHFYDDAQCHPKPVHELLLLHRVIRLHTWDKKRRRSAFFRKSVGSVFFADELVDGGAEQGADNRCSPEHPQLGGNGILFAKPSMYAGSDRPGSWGLEVGYKVIGF